MSKESHLFGPLLLFWTSFSIQHFHMKNSHRILSYIFFVCPSFHKGYVPVVYNGTLNTEKIMCTPRLSFIVTYSFKEVEGLVSYICGTNRLEGCSAPLRVSCQMYCTTCEIGFGSVPEFHTSFIAELDIGSSSIIRCLYSSHSSLHVVYLQEASCLYAWAAYPGGQIIYLKIIKY